VGGVEDRAGVAAGGAGALGERDERLQRAAVDVARAVADPLEDSDLLAGAGDLGRALALDEVDEHEDVSVPVLAGEGAVADADLVLEEPEAEEGVAVVADPIGGVVDEVVPAGPGVV